MKEYIDNGVRLAWLIDPQREAVWIYRKDGSVDKVTSFDQVLSGEDVLEGFALTLSEFWPLEERPHSQKHKYIFLKFRTKSVHGHSLNAR